MLRTCSEEDRSSKACLPSTALRIPFCMRTRNHEVRVGIGKGSCCSHIGIRRWHSCGGSSSSSPDHCQIAGTAWQDKFSTECDADQPGDSCTTTCVHLTGHMNEDPKVSAACCTSCLESARQQSMGGSRLDVSQSDVPGWTELLLRKALLLLESKLAEDQCGIVQQHTVHEGCGSIHST